MNLKEKIDKHCDVINLLKDENIEIDKIISKIEKKLKKVVKYCFVEMVVQQLMLSI